MSYLRLLLAVVARVLLCIVAGLLLYSLAPMVLGWHTDVVLTGSMQPMLRPGDVVLYQPMPAGRMQPGQIMLVHDPAHPGHLLSHRFVRRLADGQMITRGDANGHDDSTPVPDSSVIGLARIDIPRVGLPVIWWSQGHRGRTVVTAIGLIAAVLLASSGPGTERPSDAAGGQQFGLPTRPQPTAPA
jgi:signal peptidase